jgi:hypothetical protein
VRKLGFNPHIAGYAEYVKERITKGLDDKNMIIKENNLEKNLRNNSKIS